MVVVSTDYLGLNLVSITHQLHALKKFCGMILISLL